MMRNAPSTGPITVPMPPISDSSANLKPTSASENRVGGSMVRTYMANRVPPAAVIAALIAMPSSLTRATSMPEARAQSWSSRTASR